MRIYAHAGADATDEVRIHHRSDLDVTIIATGDRYATHDDHWQIKGTPTERLDFLHRLATEATEAAYRLAVETERAEAVR